MSQLFIPRPDFLPAQGSEQINWHHPNAMGLVACYVSRGYNIFEVVRGQEALFYGGVKPGGVGSGYHPTHIRLDEGFDKQSSSNVAVYSVPHGQGCITTNTSGSWNMHRLPAPALYRYLEVGKPWTWYWRGRWPRWTTTAGGALWAWGIEDADPNLAGVDCFFSYDVNILSTHMIHTWSTDAKKVRIDHPLNGYYDDYAIVFSYNGRVSAPGSTAEFACTIDGIPKNLSLIDGTAGSPLTATIQPPNNAPISLGSRQTGTNTAQYGEHTFLAFWNRALPVHEMAALSVSGLPLI